MSDLIDRQVAIDKLQKEINKGTPPFDDVMGAIRCGVRLARNIIEDLPSAQTHWIPCSERLPHGSCSDLVNVSIHDDSGDTPYDYTSCGWVTTDGEYWIVDNEINNHVVAWMPLPKPYGGESE